MVQTKSICRPKWIYKCEMYVLNFERHSINFLKFCILDAGWSFWKYMASVQSCQFWQKFFWLVSFHDQSMNEYRIVRIDDIIISSFEIVFLMNRCRAYNRDIVMNCWNQITLDIWSVKWTVYYIWIIGFE